MRICKIQYTTLYTRGELEDTRLEAWASARGGRGGPWPPPGFSHTLSKSSQISKILPFLVVNTGSILIGPPLKIFLPTPLARGQGQEHKKIRCQGQGQPFRGQTLSRPRLRIKDTCGKRSPKKIFF